MLRLSHQAGPPSTLVWFSAMYNILSISLIIFPLTHNHILYYAQVESPIRDVLHPYVRVLNVQGTYNSCQVTS